MASPILDLTRRLSRDAEAVCRHYLPSGCRQGRHWIVGDVRNTPGRSMFVRLFGPDMGRGAAGKWTDAATGEHGDLLDIIAIRSGYDDFRLIVDANHSDVTYTLSDGTGTELTIRHADEELTLKTDSPTTVAVRPRKSLLPPPPQPPGREPMHRRSLARKDN